jgi:hypothetical protein
MRRKLGRLVLVSSCYLRIDYIFKPFLQGFYSLFSVTEEPFVSSGGKKHDFTIRSLFTSSKTNGRAFTGKTRKIRYVVFS